MTQIPQTIAETQRLSDGVLLRRFVQDADELAFAIIVERHAGLVMSVCRRVVGQSADCDDAFQATFYALSQRPDSIRDCRSLTGWLYSVAWRTSVRLVRLRKRSKMETLPEQVQSSQPDPLDRIAEANDLAALDEELHQLPDKYRHVLVMNYFAQQSSQEIADQLNESKGTIDGRIREGKRMLRVRLARRGVEIGVLAIATTLTQSASASVSPALISSTTQLAKLSSGFGSMASVPGVDLAQMQVLSSTGTTVMGIKAGTFLATGVLMLSGALGFSQLMARQDGTSPDVSSVAAAVGTTAQDTAATEPLTGEIAATQEGAAKAEANSEAQVSGASAEGSDDLLELAMMEVADLVQFRAEKDSDQVWLAGQLRSQVQFWPGDGDAWWRRNGNDDGQDGRSESIDQARPNRKWRQSRVLNGNKPRRSTANAPDDVFVDGPRNSGFWTERIASRDS